MIKEHPRAAEAHHGADFLPHIRAVAVHRAFVALGLRIAEPAMLQTGQGVVKQLPAFIAQLLPAVVLPAPQSDHMTYSSLLPSDAAHTQNSSAMLLARSAVSLTFSASFSTGI